MVLLLPEKPPQVIRLILKDGDTDNALTNGQSLLQV